MRGTYAVRNCKYCKTERLLVPEMRSSRCSIFGSSCSFADDLSTIHHSRGKGRETITNKVEQQGRKVEMVLKKLGLKINNKKTQFIVCMNRQRRKPSVGNTDVRDRYNETFEANVAGKAIKESESLKTLGVHFDSQLKFKKYWSEVKPALWQRIFAISQLISHLPFKKRKQ